MSRQFSAEEVSSHNDASDLWVILHGKVYDISKFLKEHPGGEEVLLNLAGQNATTCFDDIGHSQEAKQLKDTFEIGELVGGEAAAAASAMGKAPTTLDDNDDWEYEPPKKETSPYLPAFIALAALVYAYIFYHMFY